MQLFTLSIFCPIQNGIALFRQTNINKDFRDLNSDGSYTFGWKTDDGSFRRETRDVKGLVKGKYGFIIGGNLKVINYDSQGIIRSVSFYDSDRESIDEEVLDM